MDIRRWMLGVVSGLLATTAWSQQDLLFIDSFDGWSNTGSATRERQAAAAFLQRATFGPTVAEIDALVASSPSEWLTAQINRPASLHYPEVIEIVETSDNEDFINFSRYGVWWDRSLNAPDQLRQRMAFALSQILVISDQSEALSDAPYGMAQYYDILVQHGLGNYRDVLLEVSRHPTMGWYLSHIGSQVADPALNIRPDENYAREIMQLFSVGLVMLNADGTVQTDEEGQPIPTYDQNDVKEMARVFTGWVFASQPCDLPNDIILLQFAIWDEPMDGCNNRHDDGSKTVLGTTIAAGGTPESDLQAAVDILMNHPNTAPFIGVRLIQRLVTSNPTPGYVGRVAAVFADNGQGVRGDLAAVTRAILLDQEALRGFRDSDTFGRLREPLLRHTLLYRAFDEAPFTGRYFPIGEFITVPFRQRPLGANSVFNFFAPSYSPPGPLSDANLLAPEFRLESDALHTVNSNQLDFAVRFLVRGSEVEDVWMSAPTSEVEGLITIGFDAELALVDDPAALLRLLDLKLTAGRMPDAMFSELLTELSGILPVAVGDPELQIAIISEFAHQILASSAFMIQR
ncbi:MAG: DUF1800 domain-containing protein [Pseudomonadota bacterium]